MSVWSRLTNVFRSGRVQRELDDELQFHMEERIRELTDAGMPPEAAAREVARRFGSPLRLREQSLDVKLAPWLDSLVRDVRLGARMLRKHGVVTSAAVVSLGLALGACVAAFALVDALILRPLAVRQPEQLVYLTFPNEAPDRPESDTFSDPLFTQMRDAGRGHADLFAMSTQVMRPAKFDGPSSEKEQIRAQHVSGDAFERLGVGPALGRLLTGQDDRQPGAHPVAVVSHAFWQRRFGGDPAVVGRWFTLEERPFQIVGVADAAFAGVEPGRPTDVWVPYAMYNPRAFGNFSFNWFRVFGRVKDNVRVEEAHGVLQTAFMNFRRDRARARGFGPNESPERVARFAGTPLYLRSAAQGASPLRRQFERPLWILGMIAGLVLLIAGSNVANLFLARTAAREHEMALRLSIGAGRGRLIQQVLVESALVAGLACALGLLFAALAGPAVVRMLASSGDPVQLDLRLDWRLAGVAGLLTLLTTALFGLAPALRASSVTPMTALKAGGPRSGARQGVMRPFVAIQIAFGLVVLFVGTLLVLSFARLSSVNPGFAQSNVLLVSLEQVRPVEPQEQRAALLQVLDRVRTIPGVEAAGASAFGVLGRAWTYNVRVAGREPIESTMTPVTPGFFEAMRIPVLAGRAFVARDMGTANANVIVVNETFARTYYGAEPAVGRLLEGRFAMNNDTAAQYEVVGVAADTKYDLRKPAAPTIYILDRPGSNGTLVVRVAGNASALTARLREEIRAVAPLFRVTTVTSQASAVEQTLIRERLLAMLSGFFAIVGLVLAAVGLYGVLSYSVVQRTREIGIRVALGARQFAVVRAVVADAGGAVIAGIAVGLAGGLYASRFVKALVFEVTPLDFWSLALPLGTLLLSAILAATLPALRASRVDPVIALRYE
jgi:predicted permease